jgi:hypothetical protein
LQGFQLQPIGMVVLLQFEQLHFSQCTGLDFRQCFDAGIGPIYGIGLITLDGLYPVAPLG